MSTTTASNDASTINRFKQAAAKSAAAQLRDGMVVGLGSGTTATLAVAAIGRRVKGGLRIIRIPTSEQTAHQAPLLNIPLSTLKEHSAIDVTIDGADEVEAGTLKLRCLIFTVTAKRNCAGLAGKRCSLVTTRSEPHTYR